MKHKILVTQALAATGFLFTGLTDASSSTHRNLVQRAPDNWPIKTGYVHFGDSYGAGMGTGTTSGDACRVGSNNFGRLLNEFTNDPSIDYQNHACSGDTTVGINRQIDEWTRPEKADVATMSVGGNDVGFSTIVRYCILQLAPFGDDKMRDMCDGFINDAKNHIADNSSNGLISKLTAVYSKALHKSGRKVCS
jgi:lysophospholipase L1-like esterase